MHPVLFFLLFSFCGLLEGRFCPSTEDMNPCKCEHEVRQIGPYKDEKIQIHCRNILRPDELISPMQALAMAKTKVDQLEIRYSSLMYLPDKIFENTQIEKIRFQDSEIMSLSESETAFAGLDETMYMIEAYNVKFISQWNFDQLRNLKKLKFIFVRRTLLNAIDHALPYLPELFLLAITNSEIDHIAHGAFSNLPQLRDFYMQDNKIKQMKRSTFPNPANKLTLIDLSQNMLSYLPDDFFENMPSLTRVHLDKNAFMSLSEKPFSLAFRNFNELTLLGNPLRCDCRMQWLVNIRFPPKFKGECSTPKTLRGRSINELKTNLILCLLLY